MFPCFSGTISSSDFLRPVPPHFVAFAWRYRPCTLCSLPRLRVRPPRSRACCRGALPGLRMEDAGSPRFLGDPDAYALRSSTPAGLQRQALSAPPCGLPFRKRRRPPQSSSYRGSITQLARSLCTLRSTGHPDTTQHSVPAGGQPLPGRIGYLPGRYERFLLASTSTLPPLPGFAWRTFR